METLKGRPASPKCKCCPYGFHIDLDFVKFAENIANGNTLKQNDERLSCRKLSKRPACNGTAASPTNNRSLMSPLESIFSDSLENIVSDFEETLNPRDYASDREALSKTLDSNHQKNVVGYMSDYGPRISRTSYTTPSAQSSSYYRDGFENEQSRMNLTTRTNLQNGSFSSRKPPHVPHSGSPPTYCTALGKTISEIKARQSRENEQRRRNDPKRNFLTLYRKRDEPSRPKDLGILSNQPDRSHYEQGKMSFFGSRTPEISRPSYAMNACQSDPEGASWSRRASVQRSSSAAEMNGFIGERRKRLEELNDLEPSRTLASCSDWRRTGSKSVASYNTLPPKRDIDSFRFRFNGTSVSSTSPVRNQLSGMGQRTFLSDNTNSKLLERESPSFDRYKNLTSIGTSTPPLPPLKPCSECSALREQLYDVSKRLGLVENLRSAENNLRNEQDRQKQHIAVSTSPINHSDFAGDAPNIECENKTTNVTYTDRLAFGQLKDCSVSPPPKPLCISFGVITDEISSFPNLSSQASISDDQSRVDLLPQKLKEYVSVGCCTEQVALKDCGCQGQCISSGKDVSIATEQKCCELVDRSVGDYVLYPLKEMGVMTQSIATSSEKTQTDLLSIRSIGFNTRSVQVEERGSDPIVMLMHDSCTSCDITLKPSTSEAATQTEKQDNLVDQNDSFTKTAEIQTDSGFDQTEPRVLNDSEIAESLWLMPSRDTVDVAVGNNDDYAIYYKAVSENNNVYYSENTEKKLSENNEDDEDVISITEETISDQEGGEVSKSVEQSIDERQEADDDSNEVESRPLGQQRADIVRKLLTETRIPQPNGNFVRGTATSRSCRVESKKGDSLQYITDQYNVQSASNPSTPQTQKGALKEKVVLKKDPVVVPYRMPDPIPARIPRPKIARYSPIEAQAQSPDEEAEVADRLTPLRSEMRALRTFSNGKVFSLPRNAVPSLPNQSQNEAVYENLAADDDSSSSGSEGSYDTNEVRNTNSPLIFEVSKQLTKALNILKQRYDNLPVDAADLDWATKYVQHEWLKTAARRTAMSQQVEGFIDALVNCSNDVLSMVINMTDQNENTALHYAVSHGNFDVVSTILDSRVCNLDKANKAGYTAVMLAALCEISNEMESAVIRRLFQMGNVNAKAAQHGQTALMLAVSHGKMNTTALLLQCGADLNMQDEEGSTALMCAAEHGHKEVVKLLLAQPGIDASISDCDSSTALSIAVENRHRDIGVLIYAHLNYARNEQTHHDSVTTTSVH